MTRGLDDPGVADDVGVARHREVEAVGRMHAAAGGDDRAVLHLLRDAAEEHLVLRDLVIDLAGIGPAILIAQEGAFVLREAAAGVDREELVLVGALDGAEEVRAVRARSVRRTCRRTASGGTRGARLRRRSCAVSDLSRKKLKRRPVELVGAGLGDDGEQAAGGEAVLGLVGRLRHLELADRVHREVLPRLAHLRPGVVDAVDDEAVRVLARAGADVDVAAVEEAADVVLRDARASASPDRSSAARRPAGPESAALVTLVATVEARRVDERRLAGDRDRLGERRRLQREVDDRRLIDRPASSPARVSVVKPCSSAVTV